MQNILYFREMIYNYNRAIKLNLREKKMKKKKLTPPNKSSFRNKYILKKFIKFQHLLKFAYGRKLSPSS